MRDAYTIADISLATGLEGEKLRYVIDQKLLPGTRQPKSRQPGRGTARMYTPFEVFGICCAAYFIAAGLRRSTVAKCFSLLCNPRPGRQEPQAAPFYIAFHDSSITHLELGDQVNLRLRASTTGEAALLFPWRQVATGARLERYAPLVSVVIDIRQIKEMLGR